MTLHKIINKGTGAGGYKTTLHGNTFELFTSIELKLLENNFNKIILDKKSTYGYYFEKNVDNKQILYFTQFGFKKYFKKTLNINIYKNPDEAFVIYSNNEYNIKILEKKNQNVEGSVEDKLKTGDFNRREYLKIFNKELNNKFKINIDYAFCISKFLQNKFESNNIKYINIKEIMDEDNIKLFYGEDKSYFYNLLKWINYSIWFYNYFFCFRIYCSFT